MQALDVLNMRVWQQLSCAMLLVLVIASSTGTIGISSQRGRTAHNSKALPGQQALTRRLSQDVTAQDVEAPAQDTVSAVWTAIRQGSVQFVNYTSPDPIPPPAVQQQDNSSIVALAAYYGGALEVLDGPLADPLVQCSLLCCCSTSASGTTGTPAGGAVVGAVGSTTGSSGGGTTDSTTDSTSNSTTGGTAVGGHVSLECSWCGWGVNVACTRVIVADMVNGSSGDGLPLEDGGGPRSNIPLDSFEVTAGEVTVDMRRVSGKVPLFKKMGWMNSGVIGPEVYNRPAVLKALELTKSDLRIDFSMGKGDAPWDDMFSCPTSPQSGTKGCIETADSSNMNTNTTQYAEFFNSLQARRVTLQSSITYSPYVLQPACLPFSMTGVNCSDRFACCQPARCPGAFFDGKQIECRPTELAFDNCWKCPPMDVDGSWNTFAFVVKTWSALTITRDLPTDIEIWNEPDLTDVPCPSNTPNCPRFDTTFYKGVRDHYHAQYSTGSAASRTGDPYTTNVGPALAGLGFDRKFARDQRIVNMESFLGYMDAQVPNPILDRVTFHVVCPFCHNNDNPPPPLNLHFTLLQRHVRDTRILLTFSWKWKTVGIQVNEYNPCTHCNSKSCNCGLPYIESSKYAVSWLTETMGFLEMCDLERVNWVFLMEVDHAMAVLNTIDFRVPGNPQLDGAGGRFAFWGSVFFADLPVERVDLSDLPSGLQGMAGYHPKACRGGIILWNKGTSSVSMSKLTITGLRDASPYAYATYELSEQLNDRRVTGTEGLCQPAESDTCVAACPKGTTAPYTNLFLQYPCTLVKRNLVSSQEAIALPTLQLSAQGVVYIKLWAEGSTCQHVPAERVSVLRLERYYTVRGPPNGIGLQEAYAHFDFHSMSAHLSPGSFNIGTAMVLITGFTGRFNDAAPRSLSFQFGGKFSIPAQGMIGMRIDFVAGEDPAGNVLYSRAVFIRDDASCSSASTQVLGQCQVPKRWGTKSDIPPENFIPAQSADGTRVTSFEGEQALTVDFAALAPPDWNGKFTLLFIARGAEPHDNIRVYMTDNQPTMVVSSAAETLTFPEDPVSVADPTASVPAATPPPTNDGVPVTPEQPTTPGETPEAPDGPEPGGEVSETLSSPVPLAIDNAGLAVDPSLTASDATDIAMVAMSQSTG